MCNLKVIKLVGDVSDACRKFDRNEVTGKASMVDFLNIADSFLKLVQEVEVGSADADIALGFLIDMDEEVPEFRRFIEFFNRKDRVGSFYLKYEEMRENPEFTAYLNAGLASSSLRVYSQWMNDVNSRRVIEGFAPLTTCDLKRLIASLA